MPSTEESTTACGVSSMITSTPVRCSSARLFLPSPRELGQLAVDVLLLREDALLDIHHLPAPLSDFLLDLGAEPDRLLARFDLRLAPERFCLAPGLADEQLAGAACGGEAGARE